MNKKPKEILRRLKTYIESTGYKGWDPYDALNSQFLKSLSFEQKWLRIFYIQAFKKSPVNLRTAFGVSKEINPKGIGLLLWGYSKLTAIALQGESYPQVDGCLNLLEKHKSMKCSGNAWGYPFDWQSRAFYVPKGTPTIVNTSFIGHALLDCYKYTKNDRALGLAKGIVDFLLTDLHQTKNEKGICFSYTPLDQTTIHNANLLGASFLIRLYSYVEDKKIKDVALASLNYSMAFQREDGSWPYAETNFQSWIDSFHTGFNLQALRYFLETKKGKFYQEAYERGVRFYAEHFFLKDGTPKYYHDQVYPVDVHSAAQAIVFFSGFKEPYGNIADKVMEWSLEHLYDSRGFFYFQRNKAYTNKIPYQRWAQAWMFHALSEYLLNRNDED